MPEENSETKTKPSVYIFIGDDVDAMQEVASVLMREVGKPAMADFNISRLNGNTDSLDALAQNVSLFPFGVDRRLIFYTNSLARINGEKDVKRWQEIMEHVPPTTALVLEFPTAWIKKNKKWMWETFAHNPWLEKWVGEKKDGLFCKEFRLPSRKEMPQRVMEIVVEEEGRIDRRAADELARTFGNDIPQIRQEVKKLCAYVNNERAISIEDVHLLCSTIQEEDVFAMVDAFALGDTTKALHHLKLMFANQDYARIFPMIVRQFRLLLMTKEALQEGSADTVERKIHEHPYVVKKLVQQSRRFRYEELVQIYIALYELDGEIKRGNVLPELGLELLFFEKSSKALIQE